MSVSKKLRFEVFKRDGFTCQYCGKTPPAVTLEIDHIKPRSKGGTDIIDNLISACLDCNRGKGAIPLEKINVGGVTKKRLNQIKERQEQIEEFYKLLAENEARIEEEINIIDLMFGSYFPYQLGENSRIGIKYFLKHLPLPQIEENMQFACIAMQKRGRGDKADAAIKYFCKTCHNQIKELG